MNTIIYIHDKCSTCKKAIDFLHKQNLSFVKKSITETPPTRKELEQMLTYYKGDIKKIFNTSGNLYKELKLKEKLSELSLDEALHLLNTNGMLVKRPFILTEQIGIVGFNEIEWKKIQ